MNTTSATPRNERDGTGAFDWLSRGDDRGNRAADDARSAHDSLEVHTPEHRLDSLAVNTLINRGLMIALCIIVVAVTFEGVRALTASQAPAGQSTNVAPSAQIEPATKTAKTSPVPKHPAVAPVMATTTTTPVPVTAPTTAARVFVPPATTPVTAPPHIVQPTTPPQTVPTQTVVVPMTTPPVTAPPDTVQVPYNPGK
jgi:hypothetical protein